VYEGGYYTMSGSRTNLLAKDEEVSEGDEKRVGVRIPHR
jgi:hypothetical protein